MIIYFIMVLVTFWTVECPPLPNHKIIKIYGCKADNLKGRPFFIIPFSGRGKGVISLMHQDEFSRRSVEINSKIIITLKSQE